MNPRASRFLQACRGEPVDCTPVWFMRQAGRYMAEYRAIRARHSILEICQRPDVAAEVTLQPVRRFEVDAAIIFADILLPLVPMGLDLEFATGEGPIFSNPIRSAGDVKKLRPVNSQEDLGHILECMRIVRGELDGKVPVIGFAGAPFTLASYAIEGRSSRNFILTKQLMYTEPEVWHDLLGRLSRVVSDYLAAQVEAGAQAVQLFDSWVGALGPDDYRQYVLPHTQAIFKNLAGLDVPRIHFGTGTAMLLELMKEAGGDVIGLDWRVPLREGRRRLGYDVAVQGNLEPIALFAPRDVLEQKVRRVLEEAEGRPGHVFNLGHGILPGTPVENVEAVVELVHSHENGLES
ncbi:MAG: uroporphyrinogen decarboxylase [Acidobacteriota bacterium]